MSYKTIKHINSNADTVLAYKPIAHCKERLRALQSAGVKSLGKPIMMFEVQSDYNGLGAEVHALTSKGYLIVCNAAKCIAVTILVPRYNQMIEYLDTRQSLNPKHRQALVKLAIAHENNGLNVLWN